MKKKIASLGLLLYSLWVQFQAKHQDYTLVVRHIILSLSRLLCLCHLHKANHEANDEANDNSNNDSNDDAKNDETQNFRMQSVGPSKLQGA